MAFRASIVLAALALLVVPGASVAAQPQQLDLPGLEDRVEVNRDGDGVPHIEARSELDAYMVVGYLHAKDRLFQMDQSRRQASGTLAELLGPSALASDVQLRTIGLRRAAQRSLNAYPAESVAILQAYADGVNAYIDQNPLPSEYTALELTKAKVPAWTALDTVTVAKLLAFGLSFDLDDLSNTQRLIAYQTAGGLLGFNGLKLFTDDVNRSAPFEQAPSILPGEESNPVQSSGPPTWASSYLNDNIGNQATQALSAAEEGDVPTTQRGEHGSNIWVVGPRNARGRRAMVASDPHLSLGSPATFWEVGIDIRGAGDSFSLYGVTFPGAPLIVHGTNGRVSWGSTVNPTDATDVYQEQVTFASGVPVATTYQGNPEPTQIIPETFRANQAGNSTQDDVITVPPGGSIPPVTVVVPRRNNGPLLLNTISGSTALSIQYTGFSATRELDFFLGLTRAQNVGEAIDAQRFFDVGAQNWMYADDRGNIGYKTSAEIPLREDLQNNTVAGLPPYFIRNGTGGNEWIADPTPAADQALNYEILPFEEMDGLVNPQRGWIANANQDPTGQTFDNDPLNEQRPGGGIRYITPGHSDGNRNKRISDRIEAALDEGRITFEEMQSIQADVELNDAKVLVPHILGAFAASQAGGAPAGLAALGADPQVQEALMRLAFWDHSTPTGLADGYDASDTDGNRNAPTQDEIDASIAATIYSLWRGRALAAFVDAPLQARGLGSFLPGGDQAMSALRHMLEGSGTGASGIVFYSSAADRDTKLLQAVRDALNLASSAGFAAAFGGSTDQDDYRWGKLHRITFRHSLGGPFNLPPGGGFTDLGAGLPGVATDGGFGVVDASSHNPRAATVSGFTFGSGPARRFVSEARPQRPNAVQVIPGGESGNPADPWFGNQLGRWLTDDYHPVLMLPGEIARESTEKVTFRP